MPVGLINSSWGGSQIEGWISREGFGSSDEFKIYAGQMPKTWEEAEKNMDEKLKTDAFKNKNAIISDADEKKYLGTEVDLSKWMNAYAPGSWDWQGIWAFRGQGFMGRYIEVGQGLESTKSILGFGENDSPYQLYINGKLISEGQQKGSRKVEIPAGTFHAGKNILVIKQGAHKKSRMVWNGNSWRCERHLY